MSASKNKNWKWFCKPCRSSFEDARRTIYYGEAGYRCPRCGLPCCYYKFALAARKFVKEENHRKANETHEKFLRWCRKNPTVDEKGVKLPKHWGQLKVNGRWL